jgi:hypothetical protein
LFKNTPDSEIFTSAILNLAKFFYYFRNHRCRMLRCLPLAFLTYIKFSCSVHVTQNNQNLTGFGRLHPHVLPRDFYTTSTLKNVLLVSILFKFSSNREQPLIEPWMKQRIKKQNLSRFISVYAIRLDVYIIRFMWLYN